MYFITTVTPDINDDLVPTTEDSPFPSIANIDLQSILIYQKLQDLHDHMSTKCLDLFVEELVTPCLF